MHVKPWIATISGLFAVLMAARSLHAATIGETFTFNIAPFTGETIDTSTSPATITPVPPPANPWTGSFSLVFDPTASFQGTVQAFSSNIAALNGFQWDYVTYTSKGTEYLEVGNDCNLTTRNCIDQDASGFLPNAALIILNLGPQAAPTVSSPTFNAADYTTTAGNGGLVPGYGASAATFTATPLPEPTGITVFGTALLVLGAMRARRLNLSRTSAASPPPRRNTSAPRMHRRA